MPETKAIFVNEETVRFLNYLILYKEIINKSENNSSNILINDANVAEILPDPERLALK